MGIYAIQARLRALRFSTAIWLLLTLAVDLALGFSIIAVQSDVYLFAMIIAIAFLTLFIPYMFGEKSVKKLAGLGLLIILVTAVALSVFSSSLLVDEIYSEPPEPVSSENGVLAQGTVTPYVAGPNTPVTFSVYYQGNDPASDILVNVDVRVYVGQQENEQNLSMELRPGDDPDAFNGTFVCTATLGDSIYYYRFEASNATNNTDTEVALGPLTATRTDAFNVLVINGVVGFLTNVALLFLIGLLMYWWLRKARVERAKWTAEMGVKETKKGEFTCTACGADVDEGDRFCPKCGERFDDDAGKGSAVDGSPKKEGEQPVKTTQDGASQPEKEHTSAKPVEYEKVDQPKGGAGKGS
jgi:hypothetical protein